MRQTLRQSVADGTPFPQACAARGILPGVKVDTGAKAQAGHPRETVTEGLDGLRERLDEYARMGARFAKWRAVITIADQLPTRACHVANALARCAALCQETGIVPIVEPEVLMDGDHPIECCAAVGMHALGPQPWALTFSFGRALVDPALAAWRGDPGNVGLAQDALAHRAGCNAAAATGHYSRALEPAAA